MTYTDGNSWKETAFICDTHFINLNVFERFSFGIIYFSGSSCVIIIFFCIGILTTTYINSVGFYQMKHNYISHQLAYNFLARNKINSGMLWFTFSLQASW